MNIKKNLKFNILAIISLLLICIAITPKAFQNDTFYTIKIGEHIVMDKGIDMQDPFSWHNELPYTYPHWAYDVAIYEIYNAFGFNGIYVSTVILTCILGVLVYLINIKLNKNQLISFAVTLITMVLFREYIAARAQLITFSLFIITIFAIERFLKTRKIGYAITLVIIPIIIANMHLAVWPFYFILYLPYIAEYIIALLYGLIQKNKKIEIEKIYYSKNKNTNWLMLIMVFAAFTGLLTPLGMTPYTYLIKTLQGTTTQSISEHLPIVLANRQEVLATIILFCGIIMFTKVKIKLSDLFMITGLILLAIFSNRQVSMLLLIGNIIFVRVLTKFNCIYLSKKVNKELYKICNNILFCFGILIIVITISILLYSKHKKDEFVNESLYPISAAKWINENLDVNEIRLFNEYNYGSYLLFENIPVFIDSRADLYAPEFNGEKKEDGQYVGRDIFGDFIDVSSISTYYYTVFQQYEITHVILKRNSKLNLLVNRDDRFQTIYCDKYFVIYEKE